MLCQGFKIRLFGNISPNLIIEFRLYVTIAIWNLCCHLETYSRIF